MLIECRGARGVDPAAVEWSGGSDGKEKAMERGA